MLLQVFINGLTYLCMCKSSEEEDGGLRQLLIHSGSVLIATHLIIL